MSKPHRKDQLQYVQSLLRELHGLTVTEEMLSYFIEMAYLEASDVIRGIHAAETAETQPLRRAA